MSIQVNASEIESEHVEFGVLYDDGKVFVAHDETQARAAFEFNASFDGGAKLVARTVYEAAWAEVAA